MLSIPLSGRPFKGELGSVVTVYWSQYEGECRAARSSRPARVVLARSWGECACGSRARVLGLIAACLPQRIKDAAEEYTDRHGEAQTSWNFTTKNEITEEDLCSDEDKDNGERILEIIEALDHRCKREVERPQA